MKPATRLLLSALCSSALLAASAAPLIPDPRHIRNGWIIPGEGCAFMIARSAPAKPWGTSTRAHRIKHED